MSTAGNTFILLALAALGGCSTGHPSAGSKSTQETVMVTYHIQTGKEAEFQSLLACAWKTYRDDGMVFATPHIVVQSDEDGGKNRFIEIFTWKKSPDHAPDNVKAIWKDEQSLCEARNGHSGIDGGEVQLVTAR
jgi:hypothetical protein